MKHILIIGAGRSSSSLIKYLLDHSAAENWKVKVGDIDLTFAQQKIAGHKHGEAFVFDIKNTTQREQEIKNADIVISMLPAFMHIEVAEDCVRLKKHLVTASYVSKEIQALNADAQKNGVLLLNEIGLDPGIDHMSAMEIIDSIKAKGGKIDVFKSYCGGLVAPESNDNPWGYKFSWNPRNVILAGQSTAQFLSNGLLKFIPYSRIFSDIETIEVAGMGKYDGYANRDSLSYIKPYGIESAGTVLRGTLRQQNYCKKWNVFVQLGLTDDSFVIENCHHLSYREFVESFLPKGCSSFEQFLMNSFDLSKTSAEYKDIEWLGLLGSEKIPLTQGTPAQILQALLEKKWLLKPNDKDMIIMQHIFEYTLNGTKETILSSLAVIGDDNTHTAMAKTVGLPMAIAVKMILKNQIVATGVQIPTSKTFYEPILKELQLFGIRFRETKA